MIRHQAPADNEALRQSLYQGQVFLLEANVASRALGHAVRCLLLKHFGADYRSLEHSADGDVFFGRMGLSRRELYLQPEPQRLIAQLVASLGFDPARSACDPLRLRAILHDGEQNLRAKAVYYPHRDTWYSHSQSLITCWIPLDDLPREETFVFFPGQFTQAVANNSEIFDYQRWVERDWNLKIGWQHKDDGLTAQYPELTGALPEDAAKIGFSCRRDQVLLFAGHHLHQTLPQSRGRNRFSLDFRLVQLDDHEAGRGAPNVDNRSTGSALPHYINCAAALRA
ncbi:conserved hypothetical protein [Candidatus Accumulibacter aalborgensis]|uniref:Phytanoyl-CoA dioxygenase n=1 Tax=Candidatus Accumulibacter aalborgensis TaxID=1860102 RepID=A0A1A8XQM0_9PROT|nr:hypothetical protein [Candidatus Accumulibacter aalborgensis]SBT06956.1 conserved hypothetical protein [Candidatus Accumulibacter aalborgensis]